MNTERKPNLEIVNIYTYALNQLFKSTRTKQPPWLIGLWAGVSVYGWLRKRTTPNRSRVTRKSLKPGASYVVRVPGGKQPVNSDLSAITRELIVDKPVTRRQARKMERKIR